MSSKRKLSHLHAIHRRNNAKKECPGCKQKFTIQHFKQHTIHNFQGSVWNCSHASVICKNDSFEDVDMDECVSTGGSENSDDDEVSKRFMKIIKCKVRARLPPSDVTEDSESEDEIWNGVNESDIDFDFEQPNPLSTNSCTSANIISNSKMGSIAVWICLFLCLWQASNVIPDSAVNSLLSFLSTLLNVLGSESSIVASIATVFPCSLYMLWKKIGLKKDNFNRFVICKKCFALYKFDDCVRVVEGEKESATCSNVLYPNHPQEARRRPCGETLLKTVLLANGKKKLYPFKTYCYKSVEETLYRFVHRPGFEENCEKWRHRRKQPGFFTDVYDGKIWKEFLTSEKNSFLSFERNYGLMVNLDWFQPFEHVQYSVGVIYAVILNLPRELRFKLKNVLLLGIIPDMNGEPSLNSFLQPFVDEMKKAWESGFQMTSFKSPKKTLTFKTAVICVGCDVPATRKLCGFLGHGATKGCSKCEKEFPGIIGQKNYGGFDIENWQRRTMSDHQKVLKLLKRAKTKTERELLERKHGIRMSAICSLEYFDPIRMSIIDPMHNLFQGTAKRMIKLWIDKNILKINQLEQIQEKVDAVAVASNIGAIPRKISSSFGGFTAEQWLNWTNVFSIFALKGILPDSDLEIWRKFVLANKVIVCKFITEADLQIFDKLILNFCCDFERKYGGCCVTPNMHLHCHLSDCVRDYGPVYAFWLFSFERYNGHLGNLPNNNRSVEIQFMRRFTRDALVTSVDFPDEHSIDFSKHFSLLTRMPEELCISDAEMLKVLYMSSRSATVVDNDWDNIAPYSFSKQFKRSLELREYTLLQKTYKMIYSQFHDAIAGMPMSYRRCTSICFGQEVFGCWQSRHKRSSFIMAYWHISGTGHINADPGSGTLVPGIIQEFVLHNLIIGGECKRHIFAKVFWLQPLPPVYKNHFGEPVEVWCKDLFDVIGMSSFLPMQRIFCKFVRADGVVRGKNVSIVCPISSKVGVL